jgi:septum site-determining protein MinD
MKKQKSKTKVIVVTSGKGGVGKTTTSASIAMGLALKGYKTAVLDFDIGLRNLDTILGCERRVVYDFISVISGRTDLKTAMVKVKGCSNLYLLAASQTDDKDALTQDGVKKVINELRSDGFAYIVCDSPAGIEAGALHAMYFADVAIVTTNPEISSIRDSDRIIGLLDSKTHLAESGKGEVEKKLLVTRYDEDRVEDGEMISLEDINEILGIDLIGVIPESKDVIESSNKGSPVIMNTDSMASKTYEDTVNRLLGEDVPFRNLKSKKGLFSKLFR